MTTNPNIDYFQHRAQIEREKADTSLNPQVAARHLDFAERYDLLVQVETAEAQLAPAVAA